MCTNLLDSEVILSGNEEWTQLEEKWGEPIDLETEDDGATNLKPVFSTLDLMKTTFDSSPLFNKVRRKIGRQISKGYKDFIQDLKETKPNDFFYINGQIYSAESVEEICEKIDDIFKSVEQLCSATSTVRKKLPEVVSCSISVDDLSFDDTVSEKEKSDSDDIDQYIDEAFERLSHLTNISADDAAMESVTTLVRKFSSILSNPAVNRSPRRQRQCCNKFRELADFWNSRAFDKDI